jgi:opacity protein-like surface antigen
MLFPFFKNNPPGKYFYFVLLLLLTGTCSVSAQDLLSVEGARNAGMGRCSVALSGFWNINANQAGIALVKDFSAGINYGERFGMSQLSTKSLAFLYPSRYGVIGASMDYFGYSLYHETKFGLAYAKIITPHLRAGLKLDFFQTAFGDHYGSNNMVTFEIGAQYDLSKNLTFGVSVFNPMPKPESSEIYFKFPLIYKIGLAYRFSKKLLVTTEVEKNSDLSFYEVRAGVEYTIQKCCFFRVGLGTKQEIFSTGLGYRLKGLSFDLAAVVHQTLGISPQVSLIYSFGS